MKVVGIIGSLKMPNLCLSDLTAFYAIPRSVSERVLVRLYALRQSLIRISSYPAAAENRCAL